MQKYIFFFVIGFTFDTCLSMSKELDGFGRSSEYYPRLNKNRLLDYAVLENSTTKVEDLVSKGALLDEENGYGQTVLMVTAEKENTYMMQWLLVRGANPKKYSSVGHTVLSFAVSLGKERAALVLFKDLRVNVNDFSSNTKGTLLHIAAEKGHIPIMRLLIKYRANLFAPNYQGKRPSEYISSAKGRSFLEHEEWLYVALLAYAFQKKCPSFDRLGFQYEVSQYLGCCQK